MTKILLLVLTVSSCNQVKNLISKIKGNQQQPQEQVQVEKVELPSITEAMALEELKDLPPRQTEYMNLAQEKKNMFDVSFINEAARVIRGISPAEDDIATWFNAISQGGTREGLMNGLMVDNYYRRLETKDNPLSSEVKEFTKQYMAVFLAQEFSDDVLNGVNMYTLKRVLSEKPCYF
jgi:DNA repair ATPase RecN